MNLEKIKNPDFLKQLNVDEMEALAADIREFIIKTYHIQMAIFQVI